MKKKKVVLLIIIVLFINFFLNIIPVNYKKIYKVNGANITERYIKKDKMYVFDIEYNNDTYQVKINKKYTARKKLIRDIEKVDIEDGYCLIIKSRKIDVYPLCKKNETYISFHLVEKISNKIDNKYNQKTKTLDENYKTLELYYLNNKTFLIWNYHSFYYVSEKNKKSLELFRNDYYQIDLAKQVGKYLFIPDYDQGYSFDKAYVINFKNGKVHEWNLKYEISTESRIVGTYKKSIYLLDEKNKVLYELVPHKKKIRKVKGKIYNKGKFENYNINTIINNKMEFAYSENYSFTIEKNKLYLVNDNKTLLTNANVSKIVKVDNETVYYLVGSDLYLYNPYYGNVLLISNFEWSFNNDNMIFIY